MDSNSKLKGLGFFLIDLLVYAVFFWLIADVLRQGGDQAERLALIAGALLACTLTANDVRSFMDKPESHWIESISCWQRYVASLLIGMLVMFALVFASLRLFAENGSLSILVLLIFSPLLGMLVMKAIISWGGKSNLRG